MNFLKKFFSSILAVEPQERSKLLFLSIAYACIISSYTITKDLRDTIFVSTVGSEYQPYARILSMFVFIIPLFFYAKLVDRLRRYQLLFMFSLIYGFAGLFFAYFLGHPSIGILNTQQSVSRIFGWLFYFFIEGYVPFMVSIFWAFANSISDQDAAKKNYGLMVAGSKVGGICSSLFSMGILYWGSIQLSRYSDVTAHQIILVAASLLSLSVPVIIWLLMKKVPGRYLHGYEAVYKIEKERQKEGKAETGMWAGLTMIIKYPYVLGMFGIIFFYEVINAVVGFQRIRIAEAQSANISGLSFFLYETTLMFHVLGLLISLFGTRKLIEIFGEKTCLVLVPAINFILLIYFLVSFTPFAFVIASVVTKAVHYAFSYPLKESLYIPTVKEIKFKSKSWIDTFGQKFARAFGSTFNRIVISLGESAFLPAHFVFMGCISFMWAGVAYLLGKRYETAMANNEVIGFEPGTLEVHQSLTAAEKVINK